LGWALQLEGFHSKPFATGESLEHGHRAGEEEVIRVYLHREEVIR
jgi:hypothetical protein